MNSRVLKLQPVYIIMLLSNPQNTTTFTTLFHIQYFFPQLSLNLSHFTTHSSPFFYLLSLSLSFSTSMHFYNCILKSKYLSLMAKQEEIKPYSVQWEICELLSQTHLDSQTCNQNALCQYLS